MENIEARKSEKELRIFRKAKPVKIAPFSDIRAEELDAALCMNTKKDDPVKGISVLSLATSDVEEILFRQKVAKWLMLPGMQEFAQALKNKRDDDHRETLPKHDRSFVEYYHDLENNSTNFWLRVRGFQENIECMEELDKENLPPRIKDLLNEITVNGPVFRSGEKILAREIINNMRSMAAVVGMVNYAINTNNWRNGQDVVDLEKVESKHCFGVRQYDENLDTPVKTINLPPWTGKVGKVASDIANSIIWERRHKPSRIRKTPKSIIEDIGDYLNEIFKSNRSLPDSDVNFLEVRVAYQLGIDGLTVQIIGWSVGVKVEGTSQEVKASSVTHPDFKDENNNRELEKYAEKVAWLRTGLVETRKRNPINKWLAVVSERIGPINSSKSSEEFCLAHFKTVYAKHEEQIKEIKDWQAMIERAFDDIILLDGIIERMSYVEVPCSLPEFVSDGEFKFRDIYPLRLASVSKNILPFDRFSVNGKISNLTGRNGSGKTTLQVSILDAIILAMSGLPVPVVEMTLPPVEIILLSFLDRELNRSTFQAKLQKDTGNARIIREISEMDRKKAILITDEVGSATTEESVLPLAQDYVGWLKKQEISVVMSTQIPRLSEFVGDKLGGTNLIIKLEEKKKIYEITEGIGEGEPIVLARQAGLLEIINKQ